MIVLKSSGRLHLYGYNEYPSSSCKPKFQLINEFNSSTKEWKKSSFMFDWTDYRRGCPFFVLYKSSPQFVSLLKPILNEKHVLKFQGTFGEMINTFIKKFKLNIKEVTAMSGARRLDIYLTSHTQGIKSSEKIYCMTFPLTFKNHVFLITRGVKSIQLTSECCYLSIKKRGLQ